MAYKRRAPIRATKTRINDTQETSSEASGTMLAPPSLQLKTSVRTGLDEQDETQQEEGKKQNFVHQTKGFSAQQPDSTSVQKNPSTHFTIQNKILSFQLKEKKEGEEAETGEKEYNPKTTIPTQLKTEEELEEERKKEDAKDDAEVAEMEPALLKIESILIEGKPKRAQKLLQKGFPSDEDKKIVFKQYPHLLTRFLSSIDPFSGEDMYIREQKLYIMSAKEAFYIIDAWFPNQFIEHKGKTFQFEKEKLAFYARHIELRNKLTKEINPYTGEDIKIFIDNLKKSISNNKYETDDLRNEEFHHIHLLCPTVEEKLAFYTQHDDLLEVVKQKFDPYTGISLETMKKLTSKEEPNEEEAKELYLILSRIPQEMRMAFFQTGAFAKSLVDNDLKHNYYKRKFSKAYKSLSNKKYYVPNWSQTGGLGADSQEYTIESEAHDYASTIGNSLSQEFLEHKSFGFDKGIDSSKKNKTIEETDKNSGERDTNNLLKEIAKEDSWKDTPESRQRLSLLLSIVSNTGNKDLIDKTIDIIDTHDSELLSIEQLNVLSDNGFIHYTKPAKEKKDPKAKDTIYYSRQNPTGERRGIIGYGWDELTDSDTNIIGEDRATIDLTEYQKTSHGHVSGVHFGNRGSFDDAEYNTTWLDNKNKELGKQTGLEENFQKHKGYNRTGKIFASYSDDKRRELNVLASSLPLESMNYFSEGSTIKSASGVLRGLHLKIKWDKDASEDNNIGRINFSLAELSINDLRLISPQSTLGIAHIGLKGIELNLTQSMDKMKGYFLGGFKNERMMVTLLSEVLPGFMKILPYAIMAMTEEFKGMRSHEYKDKFQAVMQTSFNALNANFSFTSLVLGSMYDTVSGMLDSVKIEQKDEKGNLVKQEFAIKQNEIWLITACGELSHRIKSLESLIASEKNKKDKIDGEKIAVWEKEKNQLKIDLDYLAGNSETNYDKDSNFIKTEASILHTEKDNRQDDARYEAKQRINKYKGKYQSFETKMNLKGIEVRGGEYVRKILVDIMKSTGLKSPEMSGVENIKIDALDSTFTASGSGTKGEKDKQDLIINGILLPEIKSLQLLYKTDSMLVDGKEPVFKNVKVSASVNLSDYMIDKDPKKMYTWKLDKLEVEQATFKGLHISMGKEKGKFNTLINLPDGKESTLYGLQVLDYDPEVGNIHLKIQDITAAGEYADADSTKKIGFGLDTTKEKHQNPALDIDYNTSEETIHTKMDIPLLELPTMFIKSPTFQLNTYENAVKVTNIIADIKIALEKRKDKNDPKSEQIRPMTIEVNNFHIGKVEAEGITATLEDQPEEKAPEKGKKPSPLKKQIIQIPKGKRISLEDINIAGLGVKMLETTDEKDSTQKKSETKLYDTNAGGDTKVSTGKGNFTGLSYTQTTKGKQDLLKVALSKGVFDGIDLKKVNSEGRDYSLKEFFKFFGSETLAGLDLGMDITKNKTTASVHIKGKKTPISIEDAGGHFNIRLPLAYINIPKLHVQEGAHIIDIPAAQKGKMSRFNDVDAHLRLKQGENANDLYIDKLDVLDFEMYGLDYTNKEDKFNIKFSNDKPIHIKNFKMGNFHLHLPEKGKSSFGATNDKGGLITMDSIEANADNISAALSNGGSFNTENASVSTGGFSFTMFKDGGLAIEVNSLGVGLPTATINTIDEKGKKSKYTINMDETRKALKMLYIDNMGIVLNPYESVDEKTKEAKTAYRTHFWVTNPKVAGFEFTMPDLKDPTEYLKVKADLEVKGKMNGGNGNYENFMESDENPDAFVLSPSEQAKVVLSKFEIVNKKKKSKKKTKENPLYTETQKKLMSLEVEIDHLEKNLAKATADYEFYSMPMSPEYPAPIDAEKASAAYEEMKKIETELKPKKQTYETLSNQARKEAGDKADKSGIEKYINAATGKINAKLKMFGGEVPLSITEVNGRNHATIDDKTLTTVKNLFGKAVANSSSLKIWSDPDIKATADRLLWLLVNYADEQVRKIADGKGYEAISEQILRAGISAGATSGGKMYGIKIDINFIRGLEWFGKDKYEIYDLAPISAVRSGNYVDLYQLIRHLAYVDRAIPKQSSLDASAEAKRLGYDDKAFGSDVKDGVGHVVNLDKDKLKKSANLFLAYIMDTALDQIRDYAFDGLEVDADLNSKPSDAINQALGDEKAGSFKFSNHDTIENIHFGMNYDAHKRKLHTDLGNSKAPFLTIPGAVYNSQGNDLKMQYDKFNLGQISVDYNVNEYDSTTDEEITNISVGESSLENLKLAVKKDFPKPKK